MKTALNRLTILFFIVFSFSCDKSSIDAEKHMNYTYLDATILDEEYEIYSNIIPLVLRGVSAPITNIQIADLTLYKTKDQLERIYNNCQYHVPEITPLMLERLLLTENNTYQLKDKFVNNDVNFDLEAHNYLWGGGRSQDPNHAGGVRVSRVAFNKNNDLALFLVDHSYGTGGGYYSYAVIVKKTNGIWSLHFSTITALS